MVIRIKKSYVVLFILIILIIFGGFFYFKKSYRNEMSKNLKNKSSYYKEVNLEVSKVELSDEELEENAFSVIEKLELDLGELIDVANVEDNYGNSYNYGLVFSGGNVQLDSNTGELVSIAVSSERLETEGKISEEELIKKASEYYNILGCTNEYEIKSNGDLGDEYYRVTWEKQYGENLYSSHESVDMVLNSKTGKLSRITVKSVPNFQDNNKKQIGKDEAEKYLQSFKELKGYNYNGEMEKQIVIPNTNYLTEDYENAPYSKIAWVAKFKNNEGKEVFVYIDACSGEIIGGEQ